MTKKDRPDYDPSELNEVLGRSPLLNGEDRDKSKKLRTIVRGTLRPKDVFDELNVREIASAIWEEDRLKKMRQGFLESRYPAALENLMAHELPKAHKGLTQEELYKKVNLEWLQAFTMIIAQEDLPIFERLIENRSSAWKACLKDYERRQRNRAKRNRPDDV
ncbi:hypothetical protein JQ634_29255 [Bradyrhizobium sp. AUGA SZCCT0240]|uniref:hypothetical protein n=1 Tax=Bradyrhizobium sp. AUGA SZCCT0240 TaxID=2807669 RepID=UPI001BA4DF87|nr:hypothetical protein [Bradyrhizobium sp. AUGA SZCCT0240]MBR1257761.1 hypothetical protein [Bradyrhizobium sp. AUGA SZCCT0240]